MTQSLGALLSRTEVWVAGLSLAAFLALFWTLRGAPLGQEVKGESDEAPRGGYRDRVIASVVLGLLLIAAGAYVAVAHGVRWSIPVFALGFGLVLTLIAVNRRHRHGSPALRRTIGVANAMLTAALLAGVLVVGNVLAFRYGGRPLDFTRERAFTLESLTLNQLKALRKPLTFTVFFGAGPRAELQRPRVAHLLELYKAVNPALVRVEHLNPFTDQEKYLALVKRVPDMAVSAAGGGVLIEYGESDGADHAVLRNNDLFELPQASRIQGNAARFATAFKGEDAVTTALIRLREQSKTKIAFTSGHGEAVTTDAGVQSRNGLAFFKTRLEAVGFETSAIDLVRDDLPSDLQLLIVVAPKIAFRPDEVAKVRAYLGRGLPALFLLGNREKSGLEDVLREYNLELGKGVIVDPTANLKPLDRVVLPITDLTRHPVVEPLSGRYVLAPSAAPLMVLTAGPGRTVNPGVVATSILRTTRAAWAETGPRNRRPVKDSTDEASGPLTVGVAVADRVKPGRDGAEGKPRMVVISSPSAADNVTLEEMQTNLDLLMNAVGWLRGRSDLIGIEPKTHEAMTLVADPQLRAQLVVVPTVLAVVLILGLGAATYTARRD